jgi:tetratricopeptide (TPR) repeat protein
MMPATAKLRDDAQHILGRAEFGIGFSLLSQERMAQKAACTISSTWARRMALSYMVARDGLRDEAIRHLEAAVELAPKSGDYLYVLARAYELADRNEDSLTAIQSAIALNPAVDEYYRVLASVAWKAGAYDLYNRGLLGIVERSGSSSHRHNSWMI